MLAIIWSEIVKKRYNKLCDDIYRSSLPYKTDSVTIIFQHTLRQSSLCLLNKKLLNFDILIFHPYFCTKFTVVYVYVYCCYNLVTTNHAVKSQNTIMHLPFVNLGAMFQPNRVDAHPVKTLCLQHTLARLSLILRELRLSRL